MVGETPEWPNWWAIADTRVKLSQCIALSLNVNPHLIYFRPHYLGTTGLDRLDPNSVSVFHARYRIVLAHRQNGECFSADIPGRGERSVILSEFARFALQRFTEPPIPKELAALASGDDRQLPASQLLATNMVAAGHTQSADADLRENVAMAEAANSLKKKSNLRDIQIKNELTFILEAIHSLGHDPQNIPEANGKPGVRSEVRRLWEQKGFPEKRFNKRWDRLRKDGTVGPKQPRDKVA